jgi:hypothetical protein
LEKKKQFPNEGKKDQKKPSAGKQTAYSNDAPKKETENE